MGVWLWIERWVARPVRVVGQSMEPSFQPGCRLRASYLSYWFRKPARGDVVVIRAPVMPTRSDLKRIIGLPFEEIVWDAAGRFTINGKLLPESYASIRPSPPGDDRHGQYRLRHHEYFVAGDNRLHSDDSRLYGPITRSAILSKALTIPPTR